MKCNVIAVKLSKNYNSSCNLISFNEVLIYYQTAFSLHFGMA